MAFIKSEGLEVHAMKGANSVVVLESVESEEFSATFRSIEGMTSAEDNAADAVICGVVTAVTEFSSDVTLAKMDVAAAFI